MDPRTEATLLALAEQVAKSGGIDELIKAFTLPPTSTSGLISYDLEAPSKHLFPIITPLRNRIPRVGGGMGLATNWRAITAIDVNSMPAGVSEGNRGGVIATTVKEFTSKYVTIGLEDYVSFEMDTASRTFEDVKALAVLNLLKSLFRQEENMIIGGNQSVALGTTPTPSNSAGGTDGSITAGTIHVRCVALTHMAYTRSKVANGGGVPMTFTRTNADGSTDTFGGGSAKVSADSTQAVTSGQHLDSVVTPVTGAVAYAWFWGTDGTTNCFLGAITTINSIRIKTDSVALTGIPAYYGATAGAFATNGLDNSQNALVFDGVLSLVAASGSGGYYANMPNGTAGTGTGLTAAKGAGIVEIDTALRAFWDQYNLGPTDILVNAQEINNITNKVIDNGGSPIIRFVGDVQRPAAPLGANNDWGAGMASALTAGTVVGTYLNKFTMAGGNLIPIRIHPNVPPGTIIFWTDSLPYPLSNVSEVMRIKTRRDYYQLEWPLRSRRYEYGVYSEQVMQCFATFAFGALGNIGDL